MHDTALFSHKAEAPQNILDDVAGILLINFRFLQEAFQIPLWAVLHDEPLFVVTVSDSNQPHDIGMRRDTSQHVCFSLCQLLRPNKLAFASDKSASMISS
jgi:hypothetical protein